MSRETPEIAAARRIADEAEGLLHRSPAFRELAAESQGAILRDLGTIRRGLATGQSAADPYALALETPWERTRRGAAPVAAGTPAPAANGSVPAPKKQATETLAARTGALVDEIDFPAFVAGLVHSTFDAIVESTIRQMEAFAELVSSLARSVDDFTRDNISPNQVRDWLRDKYPADLGVELPPPGAAGQPRLRARVAGGQEDEAASPGWLADFGLEGEPLTDELLEERVLPVARRKLGEHRMQMLSTMVLLGMNRVNVKDGSISAKVRFRAAAADHTRVDYAVGADPNARAGWGDRGSPAYAAPSTMVSTVGVNAQSDSELKAELFGEVRINFVSETLPLDRFVDLAQMQILQSHARAPQAAPAPVVTPPAAPVLLPPAAAVPAPVAAPVTP